MKKIIFSIFILTLFFSSCEKDDICVEETTPSLKIKFYNFEGSETLKKASLDSIYLQNYNALSNTINVSVDSILVPLDLTENTTNLILESNTVKDTLTFTYTRTDKFVGRSCGFKTIFEEVVLTKQTKNWMQLAVLKTQTVDNEEQTHVIIYH